MRVAVLLAAALGIGVSLAPAGAQTVMDHSDTSIERETLQRVLRLVSARFRDPYGTQFDTLSRASEHCVTGRVNARNGFGAFVGFSPFVVHVDNEEVVISSTERGSLRSSLATPAASESDDYRRALLVCRNADATNGNVPPAVPGTPPKIPERMQPSGTPQPVPSTPGTSTAARDEVPTRVAYLYEENLDNAKGADTFRGTVDWRIDTDTGSSGPEKVIRGTIDIPERKLKLVLTVRRNADRSLPASHTIEILTNLPPDFPHGAIESISGLRMKPSEQATGVPLVGASARITGGYFLIGLSSLGPDRARNVALLRDRPWLDMPLLYRDGRRAVIAIAKDAEAQALFQATFKEWGEVVPEGVPAPAQIPSARPVPTLQPEQLEPPPFAIPYGWRP